MSLSPTEVFHRQIAALCAGRFDELPPLYAEGAVVSQPMEPGRAPVLRGREQLAAHFAAAGSGPLADAAFVAEDVTVHETADPEVIVAEFTYRGTARPGAVPLDMPNVLVLRVRDGRIVESRDYHDHAELARALGALDAFAARLRSR